MIYKLGLGRLPKNKAVNYLKSYWEGNMDEAYTGFSDRLAVRNYLQSIDIATARKIGVEVYKIEVMAGMYNEVGMTLSKNMDLWLKNEPDVVKHHKMEVKSEKVYGERFSTYTDTYYFSKFKLICNSADGQTTSMKFLSLSESELLEYFVENDHVVQNKTPNLQQIAFGLLRKYPSLSINIYLYK